PPMRLSVVRATAVALLAAFLVACGVTDADIDHCKHTPRGPGQIQAVLVGTRYPRRLRVHAARALIELHHPSAIGLDMLVAAFTAMAQADRQEVLHGLLHELLPLLRHQTLRADPQHIAASGPGEQQIRAKDAGYLLLRFVGTADRQDLANSLLDWILADMNTRALAGQYTAEQIVNAIGSSAVDRLIQAYSSNEDAIRVAASISTLVNSVATEAGKDAAAARLVTVTREVSSPAMNARLRTTAAALLARGTDMSQHLSDSSMSGTDIAHGGGERVIELIRYLRVIEHSSMSGTFIAHGGGEPVVELLRDHYLAKCLYAALRSLARPVGTQYLISVAADPTVLLDRRRLALAAVTGQVHATNAAALLPIALAVTDTDIELRGLAVDRLGEARDPGSLTQLWTLFDTTNGGEDASEYLLRWKTGEAILKIAGPTAIATFMEHLGRPRVAAPNSLALAPGQPCIAQPFAGYVYREINGYALAIGDFARRRAT
ncbi:MAG: hypothetical protein WCJ30_20245, partial [Deltaproteobacteria bacterium]